MLEMGKRRLSAELADKMFLLYGAESEAIFSDEDGEALAEKTVKILKAFAEKSGDEGVMRAVNNYISLCGYLMLRNLYLVNPYNSEKIFSVGGGELDDLTDFLFHEPQSIALSAVHSGRVKACSIEPDDIESVTFLQIIRACEDIIKHGKTDFK
jgi:hypothetical protein